MKTQVAGKSVSSSVPEIVEAWELYADGSYAELTERFTNSELGAVRDLCSLAVLADGGTPAKRGKSKDVSIFTDLLRGMELYSVAEYDQAALSLGEWLLKRDYYCETVLTAFIDAARCAGEYGLLGRVCKRFVDRPAYQKFTAEPLFLSVFHADRPKEAVLIFEKFREHFDDQVVLQKVALALLRLERYSDAERLLMPLYAKLTGAKYDPSRRYEDAVSDYAPAIRNKAKLAGKKDRSFEESMELGMAYLFSGEYDQALSVLQTLQKSRAA